MHTWRLILGASILGAGAVAVACSSSSSPAAPGDDGGADGASDDGGGGDTGAAACTPAPGAMDIATFDAGASWGCLQAHCGPSFTACAASCACNNAVNAALLCLSDAGAMPSMSKQVACFTPPLTPIASEPTVAMFLQCLEGAGAMACGTASGSDAGDAGTTATNDAGDAGTTTTDDAGDAGTTATNDAGDAASE